MHLGVDRRRAMVGLAERRDEGRVVERVGRKRNEAYFVILHGGDKQAKLRIECFFFPTDDEVKGRPLYLVRSRLNMPSSETPAPPLPPAEQSLLEKRS